MTSKTKQIIFLSTCFPRSQQTKHVCKHMSAYVNLIPLFCRPIICQWLLVKNGAPNNEVLVITQVDTNADWKQICPQSKLTIFGRWWNCHSNELGLNVSIRDLLKVYANSIPFKFDFDSHVGLSLVRKRHGRGKCGHDCETHSLRHSEVSGWKSCQLLVV